MSHIYKPEIDLPCCPDSTSLIQDVRSFIEPTFNNEGGDPKCARRWPDLVNGELKSGTGNPGNKGLKPIQGREKSSNGPVVPRGFVLIKRSQRNLCKRA